MAQDWTYELSALRMHQMSLVCPTTIIGGAVLNRRTVYVLAFALGVLSGVDEDDSGGSSADKTLPEL